jgi:hemolysin III
MKAARVAAGERATGAREAMGDRATNAREAMGEKASAAREAAGERATAARDAAKDTAAAAKEATADAIAAVKPRLRGRSHEWAFFLSIGLGVALVSAAEGPDARLSATIYALSLSALLGTSALYHRVDWKRPRTRAWMRRLDHTMIFFLIAGTYTPFAVLLLDGPLADVILATVWIGAVAGSIVEMLWTTHPKWVGALIYVTLGAVAAAAFPEMLGEMGAVGITLVVGGGLLYTVGAVVYATERPNPNPAVFGYHEIFHLLVIAAAAAHFAAIAFYALPAA